MAKTVKFSLKIQSGNDAFQIDPLGEVMRIIDELDWNAIACCGETHTLTDANGNSVGEACFDVINDDPDDDPDD